MFVKNNSTGKFYIDGLEVTENEYEVKLAEFWANYVPETIVEPTEPTETDYAEVGKILLGVSE